MSVILEIAFLLVIGTGAAVALWVWWPTLRATREQQRIEYEARCGHWRLQQVTYEGMCRLMREASEVPRVAITQDERLPDEGSPDHQGPS